METLATDRNQNVDNLNQCAGTKPSISLVLPAYNEAATIRQATSEAVAALAGLTDDFEVLVVDDGSTDETAAIVQQAALESPQIKLLSQPRNLGYGAALRRGFGEASKDLVGFTDADCQFDLTELDRLVMLSRDYDIVTGYRIDRQDPWLRRMYSAGYNVLVRNLLGTRVRDCDCALKLFHREVLPQLPITTDGFMINGEMLARARQLDLSIVEVGVSHRERAGGESKVSVLEIPVIFAGITRYWWNKVMFPTTASEESHATSCWSPKKLAAMTMLLTAMAAILLLTNLRYSLIEPDETRYAQIALEMVHSGDWLVPRLHGEPYLDKPPLLYWLTAVSFTLFGENQLSARLPCTLAALLTVLASFGLGRRLVGDWAAWVGGLLLALSSGFVLAGRFLLMDSLLTLFTTVCLLCALRAMVEPRRALQWCLAAGVSCGLGVMTKGPVAPVLCFPPIIVLAWLTTNYALLHWRNVLAALVPMSLIAGPWFWQVAASQAEFVGYFFWKHNFQRFVHGLNHVQPWWFYLPVLALAMLPGTFLAPAMAVYLGRKDQSSCQQRTQELGALLLAGVWVMFFFSLSSCKLPTYILPVMPLLTLALGKMVQDCNWSDQLPTRANALLEFYYSRAAWQLIAGSSLMAAFLVFAQLMLGPEKIGLTILFALIPLAGGMLLWKQQLSSPRRLLTAAVSLCAIVSLFGFGIVVPEFANWRSGSLAAANLQSKLGGSTPIIYFGRSGDATSFTIDSKVHEFSLKQTNQIKQFLGKYPQAVVVANRSAALVLGKACGKEVELAGPGAQGLVYVATRTSEKLAARSSTEVCAPRVSRGEKLIFWGAPRFQLGDTHLHALVPFDLSRFYESSYFNLSFKEARWVSPLVSSDCKNPGQTKAPVPKSSRFALDPCRLSIRQ